MFLRFLMIFRSCCCNPKSTFAEKSSKEVLGFKHVPMVYINPPGLTSIAAIIPLPVPWPTPATGGEAEGRGRVPERHQRVHPVPPVCAAQPEKEPATPSAERRGGGRLSSACRRWLPNCGAVRVGECSWSCREGGGGRAAMVQRGSRTLRWRLPMEDDGVLAVRSWVFLRAQNDGNEGEPRRGRTRTRRPGGGPACSPRRVGARTHGAWPGPTRSRAWARHTQGSRRRRAPRGTAVHSGDTEVHTPGKGGVDAWRRGSRARDAARRCRRSDHFLFHLACFEIV
jgi:hypothetical protein